MSQSGQEDVERQPGRFRFWPFCLTKPIEPPRWPGRPDIYLSWGPHTAFHPQDKTEPISRPRRSVKSATESQSVPILWRLRWLSTPQCVSHGPVLLSGLLERERERVGKREERGFGKVSQRRWSPLCPPSVPHPSTDGRLKALC